jgi:hypothetical protein
VSPSVQVTLRSDAGRHSFSLLATGTVRPADDISLATSFTIFGESEPVDVGVVGQWECGNERSYRASN